MSETELPPFLKWGKFTSRDEKNPDVIEIEPLETDTFETEYSVNVLVKADGKEMNLPLQSFQSTNKQLHKLWNRNIRQKNIVLGKKFKLLTWLGTSKNKYPIRRFEMVF